MREWGWGCEAFETRLGGLEVGGVEGEVFSMGELCTP